MNQLLQLFIFIPFLGFIISLLIPDKNEGTISWVAFLTAGINLVSLVIFVIIWLIDGHTTLNLKEIVLFKSKEYEFLVDLCFDKITVVYILVGAFLTFLVTIYSRYYLHRERGYKRFFNTILFFYLGYNITILSGNFETLFIGWEILGICSFLLIAFYRDRYLPVKNAIKVFSVYRIGDVGLILAMWASHHLWHENITFLKLSNYELVHEHLENHSFIGVFISLMILLAAAAKSAQLPFSSWLPRAMEGPTPSSAIFYGSLSVHLGVFLLLRTFPFWDHQISVRILIALLGLATSIIASPIARVQSSVKSQIAYASIAQIGLIFIEVAAGFETFALFHFAGNAFLRTYQLLVSPSVVSYKIREQFYNYVPRHHTFEDNLPKKIEYSVYLLSLKEWNLDSFMNYILWKPLKNIGRKLDFLTVNRLLLLFIPAYIIGLIFLFTVGTGTEHPHEYLPGIFALIGLLMILKSFSERKSPLMSWLLLIMNHFWIALAISFNEKFELTEVIFYLSGVIVSGIVGYWGILKLKTYEKNIDLNQFHGHAFEHPKFAMVFLLACLGLAGFPITPTFIGLDLVFSHIHENQVVLAYATASSFILAGISLIRLYSRLFLGPHIKTYHETAYKSS
ncbi:NAD(P)H-quinone oxidoreductase subunit 2, chloroplastic [Emticicia aquatica]|uniref:NAD(P)H-quinone oxidoreductase subunit 2, chloroplastic n=1 Tax=Emticicia aquatica TaxID=1681835 RepID=A0ABM9AQP2_9BACT|nr:proton-conducting transporter membrane subunit [Emticicia aquatica]CAH0996076.1 NAD(P)H-quinone oxidoreductase subunit 2, chloroplastic [Emticicia aquatica]